MPILGVVHRDVFPQRFLAKVWSINRMLQVSLQKIIKVLSLQFGV